MKVIDVSGDDMVINPHLDSLGWYTFVCVDRHEDGASLLKEINEYAECGLKNVVLVEVDEGDIEVDEGFNGWIRDGVICTFANRTNLDPDDERAILFYSATEDGKAYRIMREDKFDFSRADDRHDLDTICSHKMTKSGIFATANEFALATS